MSFFWRYMSSFRYFFIILIYNCFWIILLWIFETFIILSVILLSIKFIIFWYSIIILFYECQIINNFFSFLWISISFFKYFFIIFIFNCFWITLVWINFSKPARDFICNEITTYFWCFSNYFFEVILSTSVVDCLARSRSICLYLPLKFFLIFLPMFLPIFLERDKNS